VAQESVTGSHAIDVSGFPQRGFGRFVPNLIATPDTKPQ